MLLICSWSVRMLFPILSLNCIPLTGHCRAPTQQPCSQNANSFLNWKLALVPCMLLGARPRGNPHFSEICLPTDHDGAIVLESKYICKRYNVPVEVECHESRNNSATVVRQVFPYPYKNQTEPKQNNLISKCNKLFLIIADFFDNLQ